MKKAIYFVCVIFSLLIITPEKTLSQGIYDCDEDCYIISSCEDFAQPPYEDIISCSQGEDCPSTGNICCRSLGEACGGGLPGTCCWSDEIQLVCDMDIGTGGYGACCIPGQGSCDEPPPPATPTPTCMPEPPHPNPGDSYICYADLCGVEFCFCNCPIGYEPTWPLCNYSYLGGFPTCVDKSCGCEESPTFEERCTPHARPDLSGIQTAIGCIPIDDVGEFTKFVFEWSIGIIGGFGVLLIIYAGFVITTSRGNPERIAVGKQVLTAAISGIVCAILSVLLLRFAGIDLLDIPFLQT